jgi:hypothetical protein
MNKTRSASTRGCHRKAWLAALLLSARLWTTGEGEASVQNSIAVTMDLPKPAVITHHDITLRTDLDQNTLRLQTTCTVRNQSGQALTELDFNLLGAEQSYGAKVAIANISVTNDRARIACPFTHAPLTQPSSPNQAGTQRFPRIVRVRLPSPLEPDADRRLHFDYVITIRDLGNDVSYGLIASSPAGGKEVNLLADYAWIPGVASDTAQRSSLQRENFFSEGLHLAPVPKVEEGRGVEDQGVHPSPLPTMTLSRSSENRAR